MRRAASSVRNEALVLGEFEVPRIRNLLFILSLCVVAGTVAAASTEVSRSGPGFQVRATIDADASAELCYEVLSDFDRLSDFIPGMQSSRIVSPPGEPLLLRQVGRTKVAFSEYTFDVTLAVAVDPPREITFRRVAGNLRRMDGGWRVAGDMARCSIDYRADIEPGFWVPPLVGPLIMRSQVARQLEGLESEIARRARFAKGP
jgi:ribosome-associated toxin RatA of RatAB toxin-antitoxin module